MFAGEANRLDLAGGAPLTEATGHQDAMHPLQPMDGIRLFENLAVHPVQAHLYPVGDPAMHQRLGQPSGVRMFSTIRCQRDRSGSVSKFSPKWRSTSRSMPSSW